MTGESAVRRAEDIGSQELSYAEVKAIASGNPAVLTLAEADAELQAPGHPEEEPRRRAVSRPPQHPRAARRHQSAHHARRRSHRGPRDAGRPCRRPHHHRRPGVCGAGRVEAPRQAPEHPPGQGPRDTPRSPRDLSRVEVRPGALPARGPGRVPRRGHHAPRRCSRDAHGPRAVLNALDRLAGSYDAQAATARNDLAIAEGQLRDYQARLGQPFAHDAYLAELTSLRDELKAALSEAAPERQPRPPAGEVAQRIQALKAVHVVEATPERPGTRSTRTAEEPVTTRIRRRGAVPALQPMAEFPPPPAEPSGWEAADAPGQAAEPTLAESSLPRASSQW